MKLRLAWSTDPAIRDFVGLSENSWDFSAPGGVPGFGPLTTDGSSRLVARTMEETESFDPERLSAEPVNTRSGPGTDWRSLTGRQSWPSQMSVPGPDTGHRETQAALRKLHRWFSLSSLSMRWVATYATSSEYPAVSAVQTQRMASGARAAGLRLAYPWCTMA